MRSLREIQMSFRAALFDDTASVASGTSALGIPAAVRTDVYRNNLHETARQTLAASYPVVARLVGEICLKNLARAYVNRFPSRCGDLAAFGREFPRLLEAFYAHGAFAYIASVARLEWALIESESASDAEPLDFERLSGLSEEDHACVVFHLHPSVRIVRSVYPILSIWRTHQVDEPAAVDLSDGGEHVLVYRSHHGAVPAPIAGADADCIESLLAGAPLEQVQREAPSDASIERVLRKLHAARLITGFALSSPNVSFVQY